MSSDEWQAVVSGDAELRLTQEQAARGPVLRLDFDFKQGGGFVVARRALKRDMPEEYAVRFRLRGRGPVNNLELKLVDKGVPYWSRPDLGIDPGDVKVEGRSMKVTVHSLGSVDAPASKVVLRDRSGKVLASVKAAALKAPLDLVPKTEVVSLILPANADWQGGSVTIESSGTLPEITQRNNRVQF